jgi:hypothetical protein
LEKLILKFIKSVYPIKKVRIGKHFARCILINNIPTKLTEDKELYNTLYTIINKKCEIVFCKNDAIHNAIKTHLK